jgi:dienelactone hydrolase
MMNQTLLRITGIALLSFLLTLALSAASQAEHLREPAKIVVNKVVEIEPRVNAKQKFILIKPEHPIASLVLLGGSGDFMLNTSSDKPVIGKNFDDTLARTRIALAQQGYIVALPDKPSDHILPASSPVGISPKFRMSNENAFDIDAVVSYLKQEAPRVPVYIVGMCMGTISAANATIHNSDDIDGLILLSAVTNPKSGPYADECPKGILDMELRKVTVPCLIVFNRKDECLSTPPSNADEIKKALIHAPDVQIQILSGGLTPLRGPCTPLSYHGYYGIEDLLVSTIANFITKHTR